METAGPLRPDDTWVLYDGECPYCSRYVRLLRLRAAIGPVRLVDARKPVLENAIVGAAGLDMNEGMVLHYQGRLHHGSECVHWLALLSTGAGPFNAVMAWVFRSPRRSRWLYPLLRGCRNATLKLLGRKPIDTAAVR
jgi:predicted DCC family thiol-disulfide oxidoreductase YuxK